MFFITLLTSKNVDHLYRKSCIQPSIWHGSDRRRLQAGHCHAMDENTNAAQMLQFSTNKATKLLCCQENKTAIKQCRFFTLSRQVQSITFNRLCRQMQHSPDNNSTTEQSVWAQVKYTQTPCHTCS